MTIEHGASAGMPPIEDFLRPPNTATLKAALERGIFNQFVPKVERGIIARKYLEEMPNIQDSPLWGEWYRRTKAECIAEGSTLQRHLLAYLGRGGTRAEWSPSWAIGVSSFPVHLTDLLVSEFVLPGSYQGSPRERSAYDHGRIIAGQFAHLIVHSDLDGSSKPTSGPS